MGRPRRRRLDAELVRRGLVPDREVARAVIEAGRVTVDGGPALKPTTLVHPGQALTVEAPPDRFVSRGGHKLEAALEGFGVDPTGLRCLDAGASTGGFTDCLLQHGAREVVAVDVGYGQIAHRLRQDGRVTLIERTNARELASGDVPGDPPDLVVADLSFISLGTVLPALRRVAAADASAIVLVKPQFEAPSADVEDGGVVRDPEVWASTIRDVAAAASELGWATAAVMPSPLWGPAGNAEFLLHLAPGDSIDDLEGRIAAAVQLVDTEPSADPSEGEGVPTL